MPLYGEQSGGKVIIQQLGIISALAIDYDSELLVWAEFDEQGGGISVADFNGAFAMLGRIHTCFLSHSLFQEYFFANFVRSVQNIQADP